MFSISATEQETPAEKIARPDDSFKAITAPGGSIAYELLEIARRTGDASRRIFNRGELVMAEANISRLVMHRQLKPLTPTAPEVEGKTPDEILDLYLPKSKDVNRQIEAAIALIRHPQIALGDLIRTTQFGLGSQWTKFLVERLQPQVTPAALLPLLNAMEDSNRDVAAFAWKFVTSTQPEKLASGRGAADAVPILIERLTAPQYAATAPLWLSLLSVQKPPRRAPLFHAVANLQRSNDAETRAAADQAMFDIFH